MSSQRQVLNGTRGSGQEFASSYGCNRYTCFQRELAVQYADSGDITASDPV